MYDQGVARGGIKHKGRYKQLITYEGLEMPLHNPRKITPTDIDGFVDFNGNAFLYLEAKKHDAEFIKGQRISFENLVKAHNKAGIQTLVIVFDHHSEPDEIVDAKNCEVRQYLSNNSGGWQKYNGTLFSLIREWESHCKKIGVVL